MNNELMSRATYYLQGGGIQDQLFRAREQFMERLSMLRPWVAPAAQIPVASRRMVGGAEAAKRFHRAACGCFVD